MSEFIRDFLEVADEKGARRTWSPAGYIDAWKAFVAACEEGYQWSIYEYENELGIRDVIDKVLTAPELTAYPELSIFAEAIADTDERFAALLRSGHPSYQRPPSGGTVICPDAAARTWSQTPKRTTPSTSDRSSPDELHEHEAHYSDVK